MQTLSLSLLGTFRARLGEEPIPRFYSAKTQALLAYLAVESTQPHSRAKLTGLLWPDFPQADANRSLRQALFQLNKTLDNPSNQVLLVSRLDVQFLRAGPHWLDVAAFLAHVQQGSPEQAVELYRGPFLDGLAVDDSPAFEEWAQITRQHLHQQAMAAWTRSTDQATARGDYLAAQHYANQQLAHDPWREEAHRALLLALAMQGQRSAALAHYARCQEILQEELGLPLAAETMQLYERIRDGSLGQPDPMAVIASPSPSPPLVTSPSLPPVTSGLPFHQQQPPLVGRQSQLTQLLSRLTDPHCRLLTLTGLGGVGKTHLAHAVAQELSGNPLYGDAFPDGIWFASLLQAETAEGAMGVVAQSLGLALYGDRRLDEQVIAHLRPRQLLLILDNCEHLPGLAGWVEQFLARAEKLKLLVTSQTPLHLWEEWLFPLQGLPVPLPDVTDPKALAASPAVALFVRNARQRSPDFRLEADPASVVRICRLVGGLPLAIELAASWLSRLSCRQIADQIEADLGFLATSARTIPDRHRSIQAVLGKTWDLLSPAERDALARLALCGGSFHAEAAQCVADADLPLLGRLVEKTLLHLTGDEHYQMHALVRRFAEKQLARRPQVRAAALGQHSDYFLNFMARHREDFFSAVQKDSLAAVDREFANVLSAWAWAADHQRFARMDQAQASLFAFCLNRGRYAEGRDCFARLAQAIQKAVDRGDEAAQEWESVLGRALARQGFFTVSSGEMEPGMGMLRAALEIARSQGRPGDTAFCLTFLGEFEGWRGQFGDARRMLDESILLNRQAGNRAGEGFALYRLGELTHSIGDFEEARAILQRCVAISRRANSQDGLGYALDQLAYCDLLLGNLAGAEDAYTESLGLFCEVGNELGMALASTGLGAVAWARGGDCLAVARAQLDASLVRARRVGHPIHIAATLSVLGLVHIDCADFAQAQPVLEEGLALARRVDFSRGIVTCLNGLAHICWETGRLDQARAWLRESLALAVETGLRPLQAEVLVYLAHLLAAESMGISALMEKASLAKQAVDLLVLVLQELPLQSIFRQRAAALLSSLAPAKEYLSIFGSGPRPMESVGTGSVDRMVAELLAGSDQRSECFQIRPGSDGISQCGG